MRAVREDLPDTGAERRRYFRVQDQVGLRYRRLEAGECASGRAQWEHEARGSSALPGSFAAATRELGALRRRLEDADPDVLAYLDVVNAKLDRLALVLALEAAGLQDCPFIAAEISAGGLAFPANEPLAIDQVLRLQLLLAPAGALVAGLGRVVRCEDSGEPDGGYRVALEFTHLRDDDRELLVQHALQCEIRQLRDRRLRRA